MESHPFQPIYISIINAPFGGIIIKIVVSWLDRMAKQFFGPEISTFIEVIQEFLDRLEFPAFAVDINSPDKENIENRDVLEIYTFLTPGPKFRPMLSET